MNCKHCKAEWTPPANVSLTSCPFCQKPLIEVLDIGDNTSLDKVLCQVTERFGIDILADRRLSAILKDLMPHVEKKYLRIFEQAVADGIGKKLIELENEHVSLRTVKIHTIKSYFCSNNGFDQTAEYVVDCFLFSLGLIDKVEEKSSGINLSAIKLINLQIEKAMENDILSVNEIELLFSLGSNIGLTENEITQLVHEAIKNKAFKPTNKIDYNNLNQKDILLAHDWSSEIMLKSILENNTNYIKSTSEIPHVHIGKQVWMSENLNVVKFQNGEFIPYSDTKEDWFNAIENKKPAWCYYDFDPNYGKTYGKIYNFYTIVDQREIAPEGYRIPSENDINELIKYIGGIDECNKLKSTNGWGNKDRCGTDDFGFNALPGGAMTPRSYGLGEYASFWIKIDQSSNMYEQKIIFWIRSSLCQTISFEDWHLGCGYSIRCIKK